MRHALGWSARPFDRGHPSRRLPRIPSVTMNAPRVLLLVGRSRPELADRLDDVREIIARHGTIVETLDATSTPLPSGLEVDVAVVLGGDGTLLGQARRLIECGTPLVGVNAGRLGFLAEFDVDDLDRHAEEVLGPLARIRERMVLDATVDGDAQRNQSGGHRGVTGDGLAINDCAIMAGHPFRMIELRLSVDGQSGPELAGDGVIIATPAGSTAYNVSAGGPIVHPDLDATIVTPNAAHSLAFRPIVLPAESTIDIEIVRANEGTMLVLDGQSSIPLRSGQHVRLRRHTRRARFVANPSADYWRTLLNKMRWAAPPTYRDRGP